MSGPPPEFVALVKDALECLYDPVQLESNPLGDVVLPADLAPGASRVQALRQAILDAVEQLDPGPSLPAGARQRRVYQILELRYVEGLPFREVMAELALSQTQYHRDQRHALEAVATLLWEVARQRSRHDQVKGERARPFPPEPLNAEGGANDLVDLGEVARGVIEVLGRVAESKGVSLRLDQPMRPAAVHGSRIALRQLAVSLVGCVLGGVRDGEVVLSCRRTDAGVNLRVSGRESGAGTALESAEAQEGLADARELLETLGGELAVVRRPDGVAVDVTLPVRRRSLLVVDDNPDAIQLIRRFLSDQGYSILGAPSVAQGLRLARQARPDVILLDVMMPDQDGWDALQALKHDPVTQGIPVFVCTVLRERQLALALGAAEFIRKPLTLPGLLEALARWTHPLPPPTASPRPAEGSQA